MAFPPSAYNERGGVPTVAAANRVRWLVEAEAEEQSDADIEPSADGHDLSDNPDNGETSHTEPALAA